MSTRKLVGLAAVVLVLGLAAIANAAEIKYAAYLEGTRADPRAYGRADWISTHREINFSVHVENVAVDDVAFVYVDGELMGVLAIVHGGSQIHVNLEKGKSPGFPRVKTGSTVEVYTPQNELILRGTFRSK